MNAFSSVLAQENLKEDLFSVSLVTATVIQSGTLYRWLLGFGDKLELLAPPALRAAVARQAAGATEFYEDVYDEEELDDNE